MPVILRAILLIALLPGCKLLNPGAAPKLWGEPCEAQDHCARGLTCAADGVCRVEGEPGTLGPGDACQATTMCRYGLVCSGEGVCVVPGGPGTAGLGDDCELPGDCQFGLDCLDGTCFGLDLPFWPGADCDDPDDDPGPFRVHFEVPDPDPPHDFYRLPFPNNIRRGAGGLDLSGHPTPGVLIDELGDVTAELLSAMSSDLDGFGANQTTYFRFSSRADFSTISFGLPGSGTLAVVDITPGSSTYGRQHPVRFETSTGRRAYICHNWLAVHPLPGRPFTPGHTYAAIVARGVSAESGGQAAQDADFAAVMSSSRPDSGALGSAWDAYAPLRDFISDQNIANTAIAGAAVFTVQDVEDPGERLYAGVQQASAPAVVEASVCGSGPTLFPSAPCTTPNAGWIEIHLEVELPQFQAGTPPFKGISDGGAISSVAQLAPTRRDPVHAVLALPADYQQGPLPLMIYGHGTGGGATSHLREGLVAEMSTLGQGGEAQPVAILGFDALHHGSRAFDSNHDPDWLAIDPRAYDPDVLFFNPLNPRAARDNPLQAAADVWSMVRLATEGHLEDAVRDALDASPGTDIFDEEALLYLGHSQGGLVGALALPYEPKLSAAALSGAGALTINSLLYKTSPNDLPALVRVGLADPNLDRTHPVLNLVQAYADRSDAVNHAHRVLHDLRDGHPVRHLLQVYGVGDTYTPDQAQYALVRALRLEQVPLGSSALDGVDEASLPVSGNLDVPERADPATGVVVLYAPAGRDAHFVIFDRADARHHVKSFFHSYLLDGQPTVEPL